MIKKIVSDCCFVEMRQIDIRLGICPVCFEFCDEKEVIEDQSLVDHFYTQDAWLNNDTKDPNQLKLDL